MTKSEFLTHDELLQREPDLKSLQEAHKRLSTALPGAVADLEKLAANGSIMALLYLGNVYQTKLLDRERAREMYQAAYDQKALNAIFHLGGLYYSEGEFGKAVEIFSSGSLVNDSVSMFWLAMSHLKLKSANSDEIHSLLMNSAALGHIRARNQLGILYLKGRYGFERIPRGLLMYLTSIAQGFSVARRNSRDRRLW